MRFLSRIALPATLLAAVATSLTGAAQNLIENPSFDSNGGSWTEGFWVDAVHLDDVGSTLVGGSGPGALEIRFSRWNGGSNGVYQEVPVTGGTSYTARLSVFVPSLDNPAIATPLMIGWYNESHVYISSDSFFPDILVRDQWMRISSHVVAPRDAAFAWFVAAITNPDSDTETRPGISFIDDALFAVQGSGRTSQELFIPAAASVRGEQGTFWTTSVWVHNGSDDPADVFGAFLPKGENNSAAIASPTFLATVPAHGTVVLDDLVSELGGSDRAGGISLLGEVPGEGGPLPFLFATSYTSTPNAAGPGSYGQGIPAAGEHSAGTTVAPGVFQSAQRRTNVGALNTSSRWISLNISILNPDNTVSATSTWLLSPYEQRQVSLINLGISSMSGGTVVFTRTSLHGSFFGYLSIVDQNTGDAVYVRAQP